MQFLKFTLRSNFAAGGWMMMPGEGMPFWPPLVTPLGLRRDSKSNICSLYFILCKKIYWETQSYRFVFVNHHLLNNTKTRVEDKVKYILNPYSCLYEINLDGNSFYTYKWEWSTWCLISSTKSFSQCSTSDFNASQASQPLTLWSTC